MEFNNDMIKVGQNLVAGAGTAVRKDIPDSCIITGVPAEKKQLSSIEF